MESNGNRKSGLLTAGGVLSIIGGVLEVIAGGIVVGIVIQNIIRGPLCVPLPQIPWVPWGEIVVDFLPAIFIIVGILILVLGAIGIAGGISALNKKSFGLSLAGAICILPTVLLGILAIIFVSVSKKEF
ncbi:MAG: hypothetical protein E3J60_02720 [Dehalococcoidia bacterium]|nr:MAG: hypothetical protein E3J60_02720 [Dehalococcoidia bacterium]